MTNKTLFISSCFCTLIHFTVYYVYTQSLYHFLINSYIMLGVLTSIINHYYTSVYLKLLDRVVIGLCCLLKYNYYKHTKYIIFLYLAILFYFLEKLNFYLKITNKNSFHLLSHIFGTYFNCITYI